MWRWSGRVEHAESLDLLLGLGLGPGSTSASSVWNLGICGHPVPSVSAGMALNDSPAGLAAFILEKFSTWTNRKWRDLDDGGLLR